MSRTHKIHLAVAAVLVLSGGLLGAASLTLLPERVTASACTANLYGADTAWEDGSGNCYLYFSTTALNWDDARTACQGFGGDLVSFNDATEEGNVVTNLGYSWLGTNDVTGDLNVDPAWSFTWVDSTVVTDQAGYHNFDVGQPDDNNANGEDGEEDCLENVVFSGTWNDSHCTLVTHPYVCECSGECTALEQCGDGIINGADECDDENLDDGDGCSSTCTVEAGWECAGEPSACNLICSNGTVDVGETCDDGNADNGDGCSDSCSPEDGYVCDGGSPTSCSAVTCGDGLVQTDDNSTVTEECDDGDMDNGDGCSDSCAEEVGWTCEGEPSACTETPLTLTWTGGGGTTDWQNPSNWDLGIYPRSIDTAVIPDGGIANVNINEVVANDIVIEAGGTVSWSAGAASIAGSLQNNGTLIINEAGFPSDADSGTCETGSMVGVTVESVLAACYHVAIPSGTYTTSAAASAAGNFLVSGGSFTAGKEMTFLGDVTLTSGTLAMDHASGINTSTVAGAFSVSDGTFSVAGSLTFAVEGSVSVTGGSTTVNGELEVEGDFGDTGGTNTWTTVTLTGCDQALTGSPTFGTLAKEVGPDAGTCTLTLDAGGTVTVTDSLTLGGFDADDILAIVSSAPGTESTFAFSDDSTFTTSGFLNITDNHLSDSSSNLSLPLDPADSENGGNALGWFTPAVPGVPDLDAGSDNGPSSTDDITNDTTPSFSGTCVDGLTVTLYVDAVADNQVVCSASAYQIEINALGGGDGDYDITAVADDGTFESAATSALTITLDTSTPDAPDAAPDLDADSDTGTSSTDNYTNDTTPEMTGTCPVEGEQITLYHEATDKGSAICTGGTYSITASALGADAIYDLHTTRMALGGNESAAGPTLSVALDTTEAAPGTPNLHVDSDTGFSTTDDITNDTTPTFTVSCLGADTVTLKSDGSTVATGSCSGESVTLTPGSALSAGTRSITATQTDPPGNVSAASDALSVTIDTTAPSAPTVAVSDALVQDEDADGTFTVTLTFGENMDQTVDPTVAFASPDDGSTFVSCAGTWNSATEHDYDCTIADEDVDAEDVDIQVSGAEDLAGNAMSLATDSDAFTIDMQSGAVCGNSVAEGAEECDDGNADNTDACLDTCENAGCGDGYVYDGVEDCDDGNADNTDACLNTCAVASCGDGYIRSGSESCDDGNGSAFDGCSASCSVENGFSCTGTPSSCSAVSSGGSTGEGGGGGRRGGGTAVPVTGARRRVPVVESSRQAAPPAPGSWQSDGLELLHESAVLEPSRRGNTIATFEAAKRSDIDAMLDTILRLPCRLPGDSVIIDDALRRRFAQSTLRGAVFHDVAERLCAPLSYGVTPFMDVSPLSPFAPGIRALWKLGVLTGYLDAASQPLWEARPTQRITLAELAALLDRIFDIGAAERR